MRKVTNVEQAELRNIVTSILEDYPEAIRVIKRVYINDMDWERCVRDDPALFRYAEHQTFEMCLSAVQSDGRNIFHVQKTKFTQSEMDDLIENAIMSTPSIILELPPELVTMERKMLAVENDYMLLGKVGYLPEAFSISVIEANPVSVLSFKDNQEALTDEMKCAAIRGNPNAALYFDFLTDKMKDVIDTYWPKFKTLLPNYPQTDSQ